jgi:hypothetical protein
MGYSFNPMPDPKTNEHGDMVSLRDYLSLQAHAHKLAGLLMEGRDLVEEYSRVNAAGIAREEALRATIAELQRENLVLLRVFEVAKDLSDYEAEGAALGWPHWDSKFDALKAAIAARKEKP